MEWNGPCEDGMVGPIQDVVFVIWQRPLWLVDGILARRHCGGASWLVWCAGRSGEDDMNSLHRNPDGRVSIWSSEQALCEEDGPQCGEVLCDQQCSLVWYGPVKMDWLVLVMSS